MLDIYHIIKFCLKQKSSQELNARMMARLYNKLKMVRIMVDLRSRRMLGRYF